MSFRSTACCLDVAICPPRDMEKGISHERSIINYEVLVRLACTANSFCIETFFMQMCTDA